MYVICFPFKTLLNPVKYPEVNYLIILTIKCMTLLELIFHLKVVSETC